MRRSLVLVLAPIAMTVPQLANAGAQAQGQWHVTGNVSGHAFSLDCRFEPAGAGFGGVCTEQAAGAAGHAGKSHTLSRGTLKGNQITWPYPVSVMLMKFDMTFSGTLEGNRISGTASAAGRQGSFVAVR